MHWNCIPGKFKDYISSPKINGDTSFYILYDVASGHVATKIKVNRDYLIEYILGEGSSGSAFYDTPVSQSLVTASNEGSIPKGDITKEIWKRLYHNAPYLLKTKGTERGLRALINCYGVPDTLYSKIYRNRKRKFKCRIFSNFFKFIFIKL